MRMLSESTTASPAPRRRWSSCWRSSWPPATGQERSATPLISVDAGFTAATAPSPDAVRPWREKIGFREAVAQALERGTPAPAWPRRTSAGWAA